MPNYRAEMEKHLLSLGWTRAPRLDAWTPPFPDGGLGPYPLITACGVQRCHERGEYRPTRGMVLAREKGHDT